MGVLFGQVYSKFLITGNVRYGIDAYPALRCQFLGMNSVSCITAAFSGAVGLRNGKKRNLFIG